VIKKTRPPPESTTFANGPGRLANAEIFTFYRPRWRELHATKKVAQFLPRPWGRLFLALAIQQGTRANGLSVAAFINPSFTRLI